MEAMDLPDELAALTDPVGTIAVARARADTDIPVDVSIRLLHVIGIARRTLGESEESIAILEEAVTRAGDAGLPDLRADVLLTLSGSLATGGDLDAALLTLDRAEGGLTEDHRARAWVQRGAFVARSGSFGEAIELFTRAEEPLARRTDEIWLSRLLSNRGLVYAYRGDWAAAQDDLDRVLEIDTRLGLAANVAETTHNLGWVQSRQGDIVGALKLFDEAEAMLDALEYPLNELLADRAEVLITARLLPEAVETAAQAVEQVEEHGNPIDLPEAWMMYARAALAAGRPDQAAEAASVAREGFVGLDAVGWQAIAELLCLEADSANSSAHAPSARAAITTASETGWRVAAFEGELVLASMATNDQDTDAAIEALSRADAILPPDRQPATLRARRLAAEATALDAAGRSAKAEEKAAEALSVLGEFRAAIAATDLRASTSDLTVDVVHLLVDLLDDKGRYVEMVEVVDSARASITNPPPVTRPADPTIAPLLGAVRELASEAQGSTEEGDAVSETMLDAEATYEAAVRSSGTGATSTDVSLPADVVGLAYMSGRTHLLGVALDGATTTPIASVPVDQLQGHLDELRTALAAGTEQWHDIERIAASIDRLLLPSGLEQDGPVVVSPPAWMVTFPWTLLPSLCDRAVTIAPRLSNYVTSAPKDHHAPTAAVLVVGPNLTTGAEELARVAVLYDSPTVLADPGAHRSDVIDALASTDILHIASHAVFRADNPLYSHLDLSDGRLHVHELENAGTVPDIVVLASCDSGAVASGGFEFTGFVSTLLGLGVRTVVAAVTPVPDTVATSDLMMSFHEGLVSGQRPSVALAEARRSTPDTPLGTLSAHTFQVFGWG